MNKNTCSHFFNCSLRKTIASSHLTLSAIIFNSCFHESAMCFRLLSTTTLFYSPTAIDLPLTWPSENCNTYVQHTVTHLMISKHHFDSLQHCFPPNCHTHSNNVTNVPAGPPLPTPQPQHVQLFHTSFLDFDKLHLLLVLAAGKLVRIKQVCAGTHE